jgi:hypothetical protein
VRRNGDRETSHVSDAEASCGCSHTPKGAVAACEDDLVFRVLHRDEEVIVSANIVDEAADVAQARSEHCEQSVTLRVEVTHQRGAHPHSSGGRFDCEHLSGDRSGERTDGVAEDSVGSDFTLSQRPRPGHPDCEQCQLRSDSVLQDICGVEVANVAADRVADHVQYFRHGVLNWERRDHAGALVTLSGVEERKHH